MTEPSDIEFEFAMPKSEYQHLFTLRHGFGLGDLNSNIEADLSNNFLTIEIEKSIYASACIEAFRDDQLVLSISGMHFKFDHRTLSISIIDIVKLRITVDIIAWPPLATRISNVL